MQVSHFMTHAYRPLEADTKESLELQPTLAKYEKAHINQFCELPKVLLELIFKLSMRTEYRVTAPTEDADMKELANDTAGVLPLFAPLIDNDQMKCAKTLFGRLLAVKFDRVSRRYDVLTREIQLPIATTILERYATGPFGGKELIALLVRKNEGLLFGKIVVQSRNKGFYVNPLISFLVHQLQMRKFTRPQFNAIIQCAIQILKVNPNVTKDVSESMRMAIIPRIGSFNRYGLVLPDPDEESSFAHERAAREAIAQPCFDMMDIIEPSTHR